MKIGLDWDNTFTSDPETWQKFIHLMNDNGHEVYITTARSDDTPIEFIPDGLKGIIYCTYKAKLTHTYKQGIAIDIWVDDDPSAIIEGFI